VKQTTHQLTTPTVVDTVAPAVTAPAAPAAAAAEAPAAEETAAALFAAFVAALTAMFCMTCSCNLHQRENGIHNKGDENGILSGPTTINPTIQQQ
jgi:hypothetical protein